MIDPSSLDESGEGGATCLHNLLYIAEQLAMTADPFSLQFSGLFEPVLRLLVGFAFNLFFLKRIPFYNNNSITKKIQHKMVQYERLEFPRVLIS